MQKRGDEQAESSVLLIKFVAWDSNGAFNPLLHKLLNRGFCNQSTKGI